jgi:hypothetical protein
VILAAVLVVLHVQNWMNACSNAQQTCHEAQNVGIAPAWMASHVDWNEVYYDARADSTSAQLAAAGAKHIVEYTDPNIAAYCPVPSGTDDGRNCNGAISQYLHAVDGSYAHAYEHQNDGARLVDRADGAYRGTVQEPFYIGDPDVREAFDIATLQDPYATDVFEDDAGGSYNCIFDDLGRCSSTYGTPQYQPEGCDFTDGYWCYKYGATAYEYDRTENPQAVFAYDAISLADAASRPVIGNDGVGTDRYDLQWLEAGRVEGAMAENAWNQRSNTARWIAEADAILEYHELRKFVVEYSSDESRLFFQIASHWIVYDPRYSIEALAEVNPAMRSAGENDTTFPEETIVPADPRIATAPSSDVRIFETAPGVFVREYARCFQDGVPIGFCAAVVNTGSSSEPIAGLTEPYGRVLIHNSGETWAAGGQALWSSAVPRTIAANSGAILAR